MTTEKYLLTLTIGEIAETQEWTADEPAQLGTALPWMIEKTEKGIVLTHESGHAVVIKDKLIESESSIELPTYGSEAKKGVALQIKQIPCLTPVYETPKNQDEETFRLGEWRVSEVVGNFVVHTQKLGDHYEGRFGARNTGYRTVFAIRKSGQSYRVDIIDPAASVSGGASLEGKGNLNVDSNRLGDVVISLESRSWRFSKAHAPILVSRPPMVDPETVYFHNSIRNTVAGLAAILLLNLLLHYLMPEKEEEKKEVQVAQIKADFLRPKSERKPPEPVQPPKEAPKQKKQEPKAQEIAEKVHIEAPKVNNDPKPAIKAPQIEEKQYVKKTAKPDGRVKSEPSKKIAQAATSTEATHKSETMAPAVMQAKQFQDSVSSLLKGGSKALLAKSNIMKGNLGSGRGGRVFGASRKGLYGTAPVVSGSAPGAGKVNVAYAGYDSDGSDGNGVGALSYAASDSGSARAGGTGGKFVSIAREMGNMTMSDEGLTREEVWAVIERHLSEVQNCWETAITRRPDIGGKLLMNFVINGQGSVKFVNVKDSSISDRALGGCVSSRLKTWRFPKPKGAIDVGVQYPFVFRRL